MKTKKRVIIVAPFLSSFIQNDIAILSKEYYVKVNLYDWKRKQLTPIFLLHQIFYLIKNIRFTEKILVEFGGYWSLFPALAGKLFGVPVFIVLHGTDCASIPSVNYGSLRKYLIRLFCKGSYKLATVLLPVSSSLVFTKNTYNTDDKFSLQGFKHFFPKNKTPYHIIPNGIDECFWKPLKGNTKENYSFIAVFSDNQFILKGGDLIISLAQKFTNCKFYIAGMDTPQNRNSNLKNVFFLGKLSKVKLREYYNRCQFHFQLSIFEGFGLALCEAMLCHCIPIGSSVNIIPEIIGNTGFILQRKDLEILKVLITKVLKTENKEELGSLARERIVNNYNIELREKMLIEAISKPRRIVNTK